MENYGWTLMGQQKITSITSGPLMDKTIVQDVTVLNQFSTGSDGKIKKNRQQLGMDEIRQNKHLRKKKIKNIWLKT